MLLAAELIPTWFQSFTAITMAFTLVGCIRYADWPALFKVPQRLHLVFAALLFLVVLWMLSVRSIENLYLHFCGVTAVTLLLGWRFTMLVGAAASFIYALLMHQAPVSGALGWLLCVLVPATVSRLLVLWLRQRPQSNLFIFLLGAGFGGGVLSAFAICAATLVVFSAIGQQAWVALALENWPLVALLAFPEGFINGMVLSVVTVWYPDAVKTFDSDKYLGEGD